VVLLQGAAEMGAVHDRWVDYRATRDVVCLARSYRKRWDASPVLRFCIVQYLYELAPVVGFEIVAVDVLPNEGKFAYVTFNPLRLVIEKVILAEAKLGDPKAVYVIAHELGHLIIHKGQTLHYSDPSPARRSAPETERSAEWQADVFAHFFLVSEAALADTRPPADVAIAISVERTTLEAVKRYDSKRDVFRFVEDIEYAGDSCGECGNFTLVRNGTCLKCDTCGSTTGYS
jgi:hypothetical protein